MSSKSSTAKRTASASPKRSRSERSGPLVTPDEAGDYLAVTPRQVRRLFYEKKLPGCYVGGLLRFHVDDLDEYIKEARTQDARPRLAGAVPVRRRTPKPKA